MLQAILRESISKSGAKALRNDGYLIANIYGKGAQNVHCAIKYNEFLKFVKSKTTLSFPLNVEGKNYEVVIQEYQRDPVTNRILHVDLMLVQKGVVAQYKIPVKISGTAKGLKNKGVLLSSKKRITVKCAPEFMPTCYDLDVSELDVGDTILIRDLAQMANVTIVEKPQTPIVGVIKAK